MLKNCFGGLLASSDFFLTPGGTILIASWERRKLGLREVK